MESNEKFQKVSSEIIKVEIRQMLEKCKIKEQSLDQLPEVFMDFLKERGLDQGELTITIPRYIRVKPEVKITTE